MEIRKQHGPGLVFRHITTAHSPGVYADLHCHNFFELIYVVSGDIAHVVEGRKYLLRAGDLVLVQPSQSHYLQILSDDPYERYNILFDPQMHSIPVALQLPKDLEVINLSGNSILSGLFSKMDFYAQAEPADFAKLLKLLLNELCMNLLLFSSGQWQRDTAMSPILTRALEYINTNLYTVQNVEEVAQALFVSSSYLYRLFNTTLHQSPKKYIMEKRLLAAQRLLRAGSKPSAVYRECGFREYTTFFRSYCKYFGSSPSSDFKKE